MKVYAKVVVDMATLETLEEDFFEYEGPMALCGGGDGVEGDTEYNARIATIAEQQNAMALEMYNFYKYGTFGSAALTPEQQYAGSPTAQQYPALVGQDPASVVNSWERETTWNGYYTVTLVKNPYTGDWEDMNHQQEWVQDIQNQMYKEDPSIALGGTGTTGTTGTTGGTTPLYDSSGNVVSYANMELAQIQANMNLLPNQTALTQEQIASEMAILPVATDYTLAQYQAQQPVMQAFYSSALEGEDRDAWANRYAGDVVTQFGDLKAQTNRDLGRMGFQPGSAQSLAANRSLSANQALGVAGAMEQGRQYADDINFQRLTTAAGGFGGIG